MKKRLGKALQALAMILLITLACMAFMPWKMSDVVDRLGDVRKCMVLRYDEDYDTAYPQEQTLEELVTALGDATGTFDRKRQKIADRGDSPMYRIYFWDGEGRIPDVWVCGPVFFYDGAQYILNDKDAEILNDSLSSCFP